MDVVTSRGKILFGGAAAVAAAVIALIAWLRIEEARRFAQPHRASTDGGTNYVVRLLETTLGKIDSGYALIVYAQIENPNPYEVVLRRNQFALADQVKGHFLPATNGERDALIKLPAGGVLDREMFSFNLPPDSLRGSVELRIGGDDWVMIKNEKPFTRQLRSGQFVSFRTRVW